MLTSGHDVVVTQSVYHQLWLPAQHQISPEFAVLSSDVCGEV